MRTAFVLLFLLSATYAGAQVQATKYANEFLAIGVGSRALAMGNTQVAVANDVTAGYWNPAGLLNLPNRYGVILQHGEYFSGIAKFDYAAFAMQLDTVSSLGFSVIRFGIDDIPDTRFLYDANGAINYDNVRFFAAADYAFLTSYARKLPVLDGLQVGGNFKVIYRQAGSFANGWGFGLDVGARLQVNNWQLGAVFRDATGTFTAWSHNPSELADIFSQTGNEIPQSTIEVTVPRLILGAAYRWQLKDFGLLPTLDLTMTFDGKRNTLVRANLVSLDPTFGFEADYLRMAFVRLGVRNVQQLKSFDGSTRTSVEPTFGMGFRYKAVQIDYALTSVGPHTEGLLSHIFSVQVNFDGKE